MRHREWVQASGWSNSAPPVGLALCLLTLVACSTEPTEPALSAELPSTVATTATAALAFRQVSAGNYHSCGVTVDDRAYCWGLNEGRLGDGTTTQRLQPVPVVGGLRFRSVSVGDIHTCGVATDDRAYCWGAGGLVGDGTWTSRLQPVLVAGSIRFRQVDAGSPSPAA